MNGAKDDNVRSEFHVARRLAGWASLRTGTVIIVMITIMIIVIIMIMRMIIIMMIIIRLVIVIVIHVHIACRLAVWAIEGAGTHARHVQPIASGERERESRSIAILFLFRVQAKQCMHSVVSRACHSTCCTPVG